MLSFSLFGSFGMIAVYPAYDLPFRAAEIIHILFSVFAEAAVDKADERRHAVKLFLPLSVRHKAVKVAAGSEHKLISRR